MKTKTRKPTPFFTLSAERSHSWGDHYNHLNLFLFTPRKDYSNPKSVKLRWQAHVRREEYRELSEWLFYGGHLDLEAEGMEELESKTSLVRRLFGKIDRYRSFYCPMEILELLVAAKIPQYVYDHRESEEIPVEEVKPANWKSWRDNYNRYEHHSSGCHVGCMADSEDEARRLLTLKFAEEACQGSCRSSDTEDFQAWMAAGQPVLELEGKMPEILRVEHVMDLIRKASAPENRRDYSPPVVAAEISETMPSTEPQPELVNA